jgi:hypothetical protein
MIWVVQAMQASRCGCCLLAYGGLQGIVEVVFSPAFGTIPERLEAASISNVNW